MKNIVANRWFKKVRAQDVKVGQHVIVNDCLYKAMSKGKTYLHDHPFVKVTRYSSYRAKWEVMRWYPEPGERVYVIMYGDEPG